VRAGSAKIAVGRRFRGFVYHSRASLGRFCDKSSHLTRPGDLLSFPRFLNTLHICNAAPDP
jgi:hypothetical protein